MPRKVSKGETKNPTVQVPRESKDRLVDWLARDGYPEQGFVLGRLIDWFVAQEPEVQQIVLGRHTSRLAGAYATVLRQLADRLVVDVAVTGKPGANSLKSSPKSARDETTETPTPTRHK
jgi:hypothetical protein